MSDPWQQVYSLIESQGHKPATMTSLELICDLAGLRPEANIQLTDLSGLSAFPNLTHLRVVGFGLTSVV